jgi:spoIIIJ-associated protein
VERTKFTVESSAPRIERFLERIRHNGRFEFRFDIGSGSNLHADFENPEILVRFHGPDVDLLLANKAEFLLALEQLTMEMLRMSADEHSLLQFDANDYRLMRIEELRMSAVMAAEKVRKTRVPFQFSPMNSRERRIIHLSLRNEPEVRSESAGAGPARQVIVYPAGMPSLPPKAPPPAVRRPGGRGRR